MSEIKDAVRSRYADAARQIAVLPLDSTAGCCGVDGPDCGCAGSYATEDLKEIGLSDAVSLGCGNPTMLADLKPGEVVLDLGSGAGLDVLLSARRVSPGGQAYGVDMTDEMLELANRNREMAGITNATFLKGSIENVPLPDEVADTTLRQELLRTILGTLSHRERRVLELRYGLDGEQPRTLDEVGRAFNVTRERIRQIENQSLKKLRALAETGSLKDVA